jgi:hypothetical protein
MSVKKQAGRYPCTALLKDGTPCGRYYKSGDPEPFCSVHRSTYAPKGAAIPRPKPVSYDDRLRRFAESSDARVAMQAIGILTRRAGDGSKSDPEGAATRRLFLEALTVEERTLLAGIIDQYKELQRAVFARRPDLPRFSSLRLEEDVPPSAAPPSASALDGDPSTEEAKAAPVVEDEPLADDEEYI